MYVVFIKNNVVILKIIFIVFPEGFLRYTHILIKCFLKKPSKQCENIMHLVNWQGHDHESDNAKDSATH